MISAASFAGAAEIADALDLLFWANTADKIHLRVDHRMS
jgi:hypothetical protein